MKLIGIKLGKQSIRGTLTSGMRIQSKRYRKWELRAVAKLYPEAKKVKVFVVYTDEYYEYVKDKDYFVGVYGNLDDQAIRELANEYIDEWNVKHGFVKTEPRE